MSVERFHAELKAEVAKVATAHRDAIAAGQPKTIEEYRDRVGYLRGLNDALTMADTVKTKVTGGEE